MNRNIAFILLLSALINTQFSTGQRKNKSKIITEDTNNNHTPKLVVGIVVDQMRYDYLSRFDKHFSEGGFKRLIGDGFSCNNHHFNFAPTKTAPGHAAIYSGASPKKSGIMGNSWYDRALDSIIYCVDDLNVDPVGTTSDIGKKSPHRLLAGTITDQLRLHYQKRSKTISIAFKDRSSILPAGFLANGAYWYYGEGEGKWVSSTHYMKTLPEWVRYYNESDAISRYKKPWIPLKDLLTYSESGPDNTTYEHQFVGENAPVLPRDIPALWESNGRFDLLKYTPFSNSITTEFALAAVKNEDLGKDPITDFLAISYSGTDEIGHKYGVNSKEVQDAYLRLDLDLKELLLGLDEMVGPGNYMVFLTADHGAVHVPAFLKDNKIPGGYFSIDETMPSLKQHLKFRYGTEDLITGWYNNQIFLDHRLIKNLELSEMEVQETISDELKRQEQILMVLTATQLRSNDYQSGLYRLLSNGYNQKRSGDIYYVLKPGYLDYKHTGSDHGSPHVYDTHVPLLFYGHGIKNGSTFKRTETTDIAPTLAAILGVACPNASMGTPIGEVLE